MEQEQQEKCGIVLDSIDSIIATLTLPRKEHEALKSGIDFLRTTLATLLVKASWADKYKDQIADLQGQLIDTTLHGVEKDKTISI